MQNDRAELELKFLGSGNAFAGDRYWSSFVLNGRYLFDAPPQTLAHLNRLNTSTVDIDVVFISHFHADHFFGLPFLFLDYAYTRQRNRDLIIVGPRGAEQTVEKLTEIGFPGLLRHDCGYERRYIEVRERERQTAGDLPFQAIKVDQSMSVECYGFRVEIGDRVVSYTGDTMMCDGVFELARDAHVLVVDCTCWETPCQQHMSLDDIRHLRKDVPLDTTFVITHLDTGRPNIDIEGVVVAEDLATLRF